MKYTKLNTIIAQKLCKELGLSEAVTRYYVTVCSAGGGYIDKNDDYDTRQALNHLRKLGLIKTKIGTGLDGRDTVETTNINYFYLKENIEYALMFENIDNAN